jgi:hypothetical protein
MKGVIRLCSKYPAPNRASGSFSSIPLRQANNAAAGSKTTADAEKAPIRIEKPEEARIVPSVIGWRQSAKGTRTIRLPVGIACDGVPRPMDLSDNLWMKG